MSIKKPFSPKGPIETPHTPEEIWESIKTISRRAQFLTPAEEDFLVFISAQLNQRFEDNQSRISVENNTTNSNLNVSLSNILDQEVYPQWKLKNILTDFATANGFELFPRSGMATQPIKTKPSNALERKIIISEGEMPCFIQISSAEKRIYIYVFGMGIYFPSPL